MAPPNIPFSCADPINSLWHGTVHFLAPKRQYLHYNTFCIPVFLLACAMAPSLMLSPVNPLKYTRTLRRITDLDKNPQRMLKVWVMWSCAPMLAAKNYTNLWPDQVSLLKRLSSSFCVFQDFNKPANVSCNIQFSIRFFRGLC